MKKHYLDIGFEDDFLFFGIVTDEAPHRLAWLMNNQLNSDFVRQEDIPLFDENGNASYHPRFDYYDEINRLNFYLLGNKDESTFIISELNKVDFFVMVKGALDFFKTKSFTNVIKQIDTVRLISEISPKTLKSKHNLIIPELKNEFTQY